MNAIEKQQELSRLERARTDAKGNFQAARTNENYHAWMRAIGRHADFRNWIGA